MNPCGIGELEHRMGLRRTGMRTGWVPVFIADVSRLCSYKDLQEQHFEHPYSADSRRDQSLPSIQGDSAPV